MSGKEANLRFSLSPSLETMPMQHDLLRFSKIGPSGLDKKGKSEKIYVTVFQYYPLKMAKNSKQQKIIGFGALKTNVGQRVQICFICHLKGPSFEVILENFEVLNVWPKTAIVMLLRY